MRHDSAVDYRDLSRHYTVLYVMIGLVFPEARYPCMWHRILCAKAHHRSDAVPAFCGTSGRLPQVSAPRHACKLCKQRSHACGASARTWSVSPYRKGSDETPCRMGWSSLQAAHVRSEDQLCQAVSELDSTHTMSGIPASIPVRPCALPPLASWVPRAVASHVTVWTCTLS